MTSSPLCYELRVSIDDAQKEALVSLLNDLGETTFVEGAVDCDVEFEYNYEHVSHDYYAELAHNVPLSLYGEDLAHLERLRSDLLARADEYGLLLTDAAITLAPIADQNWRDSWKASFKPVDVAGTFVILPPWEDPASFMHPHKIIIDPGMAFGTGQHETTRLCLEMFLNLPTPARVFDVGSGSGILAIAASMAGSAFLLGNDIDAESVKIARENASANGVHNVVFTDATVDAIPEKDFDLIFANIQFKPLSKIFPDITARLAPGGHVLISGILAAEVDEFRDVLASHGAHVLEVKQMGHWTGILCEHARQREQATV